ncbi:hypothetical protein [Candidatus Manganitrophus noduliformans]|uniref:Uncharacterized protein n=1 Tax=Candidatus Manganitrophus noduliformans TaxID=2606439 RepID=A0A7X6DMD9_9BACT|nr:hypothetical protein [Candidatus Manganitrophus noduliformans]NKE69898.1 hypothetical protein [Candidatus Manganitrophus noduliformans]
MEDLNATPKIEFRTEEEQNFPGYYTNYFSMLKTLNRDRLQTLSLERRGFEEINPALGPNPSKEKINTFFALRAAVLSPAYLGLMEAPDWVKSSVADSAKMMGEMVTDQNARLFRGEKINARLPIAAKFTYHGDWDRFIEDKYRIFTGDK